VANVTTSEIRTYLKKLKNGSNVDIAKFLDNKKVTDITNRGIASGNFKRILKEFPKKNLTLLTLEDAYDQFVPLTEDQKKVAKEVYKKEIKKYKNFDEWQRDVKNRYKVSDIRQEKTTLDTKPTGIIKNDPDRIIARSPRGSENLTDVVFPDKKMSSGKTMKQEFLDDLEIKFSKPRGSGLTNADFVEKYPIGKKQVQRVINYYISKLKLKYPKGKTATEGLSYGARKEKYGDVTDLTIEEDISKRFKRPVLVGKKLVAPRGKRESVGLIDFAHRISKDHAKALGIQFGTENTGLDSRLINQIIVRPSEIRLEAFYKKQRDLLKKIEKTGLTNELAEKVNTLNNLINKEVKKTSGRLIGINIDPKTLEVSFTGQKKKFKLSNLNKTFKEIKEIPFEERNPILRNEVAKAVDAEVKRGFRPYDFKEILSDPKNTKTLLKYAKDYAPDIFDKFKNIMSNPLSKRRFAVYSKLPAALIPAGLLLSMAAGSPVEAAEVTQPQIKQSQVKQPAVSEPLRYDATQGSIVNANTDQRADQNQILQYVKDNPLKVTAGASLGFAAEEVPGAYKAARDLGRGRVRSTLGISGAIRPVLTTFGTPLITGLYEGAIGAKRLEDGETMTDILTDPVGPALGLTLMEPLSKLSGVVKDAPKRTMLEGAKNYFNLSNVGQARPGLTGQILRMGLSPRMIAGASRFLGLPGIALGAGLAGYDAYKNYQNQEGMIYNLFNKDG